jgi:hypothetical protein
MTTWEIKGRELVNCSCEYGCNCQFNALPDKGHCHAVAGIQIEHGHHGDTPLDGLRIAAIFKWPGPIHEGNGEAIAFVDANADAKQREALLKIMTGQDTDPFATMFAVYASTVTTMNEPVFTDIDLQIDVDARKGRIFVKDYIDTVGTPILNKVTGAESRAQIVLPEGLRVHGGRGRQRNEPDHRSSGGVADRHLRAVRPAAPEQSRCRSRLSRAVPALERLLKRDGAVTAVGLFVLCAAHLAVHRRGRRTRHERVGHDHDGVAAATARGRIVRHGSHDADELGSPVLAPDDQHVVDDDDRDDDAQRCADDPAVRARCIATPWRRATDPRCRPPPPRSRPATS